MTDTTRLRERRVATEPVASARQSAVATGRAATLEAERLSWRTIRDVPRSGARNMALDHALAMSAAEDGVAVLRLYAWTRPTVSFGRNERVRESFSRSGADARGIDCVRRPTGGRAVLHAGELTYAVASPIKALGGARAMYARINHGLSAALRVLGANVAVSTEGRALGLDAGPCFQSPVAGEVVADGAKLVGSAQARLGGALLQHGSILISPGQDVLDELTGRAPSTAAVASLTELVGAVDETELSDAVVSALKETLGGTWSESEYSPSEIDRADLLEARRYGADEWTWRR